jgi:hypothetical protein
MATGYQPSDVLNAKSGFLLEMPTETSGLPGSSVAIADGEIESPSDWPKPELAPDLIEAVKAQISEARQARLVWCFIPGFNGNFFRKESSYSNKHLGGLCI